MLSIAVSLALLAAPAAAESPYEPNDSLLSAAGPLVAGQTYDAALETSGDRDFYYFYATSAAAARAELTVRNLGGDSQLSSVNATIFDGSETPVTGQAFIADGESRALTASLAPQKYYVEVSPGEGYGDSYSLTAGGDAGAFGPYETIAGRCAKASAAASAASRDLSRAKAKLLRATARVRRSRYAPAAARRRAGAAHSVAVKRVQAKRQALRGANRSLEPWCSIPR